VSGADHLGTTWLRRSRLPTEKTHLPTDRTRLPIDTTRLPTDTIDGGQVDGGQIASDHGAPGWAGPFTGLGPYSIGVQSRPCGRGSRAGHPDCVPSEFDAGGCFFRRRCNANVPRASNDSVPGSGIRATRRPTVEFCPSSAPATPTLGRPRSRARTRVCNNYSRTRRRRRINANPPRASRLSVAGSGTLPNTTAETMSSVTVTTCGFSVVTDQPSWTISVTV